MPTQGASGAIWSETFPSKKVYKQNTFCNKKKYNCSPFQWILEHFLQTYSRLRIQNGITDSIFCDNCDKIVYDLVKYKLYKIIVFEFQLKCFSFKSSNQGRVFPSKQFLKIVFLSFKIFQAWSQREIIICSKFDCSKPVF